MPLPKKCSCRQHDTLSDEASQVSNIKSSKKFKTCAIEYLIEHGMLETYHTYLCEDCYRHGLQHSNMFTFEQLCQRIENGELTDDQFVLISKSFAKLVKVKLNKLDNTSTLQSLEHCQFRTEWMACEPLKHFLSQLTNDDDSEELNVQCAKETLMQLAISNYIGPLHFAHNVIGYFISGSKKIVELNASFSPCGSYPTVLEFLKNKTIEDHFPKSDSIFFFDNNQIMARSWNVQYASKPLISVITTVVSLVPPIQSILQDDEQYMPARWMGAHIENVIPGDTADQFRAQRNIYIESQFEEISECKDVQPSKLRKVQFDSGKVKATPTEIPDPYDSIPSHVEGQTEVVLLNPILVNPCSYQSLEVVMDNIIEKAGKKWVAIGCDGLPFNLCSKMIDNYFICSHCAETFNKREHFKKHAEINGNIIMEECKKYKNVLLIPGFGHLDINITRGLFKLLWKVCVKELAILLGWKSIKALTSCENCSDHHKSTQILNVLITSLNQELLRPFLNTCRQNQQPPTLQKLYEFADSQGANYQFLFKVNFTYLFAWKLYKKGMRRANYQIMKLSLDKLSQLFYGLNMTTYMDLWLRFEHTLLRAPEPVKHFIEHNVCMSQSGHPSKAEGGDFILEATNKNIKSHMPHGVPTDERWNRVCSNIKYIDKIQEALHKDENQGSGTSTNAYFRKFDDPVAVREFSKKLRTYVMTGDDVHTSIDGQRLDHELVDFDVQCIRNKDKYYQSYPNVLRICQRVFITPADRLAFFDISNKTKQEIQAILLNLLKDIEEAGGDEEVAVLRRQHQSSEVKNGTKSVLLTFYSDVVKCLEEVTCRKQMAEADSDGDEQER